jgi:hypothetical protein
MFACLDDGTHYNVPPRYRKINEMMAIYRGGKAGAIGFKVMMECLSQYIHRVAQLDAIFTTNDDTDTYTGNYYKSKFLMNDAGVRLTYRDFGGKWNLIWTDKIEELCRIHKDLFRR